MTDPEDPHPRHRRRRPEIPFPPHRYLPGRGPHPTKHPDGHGGYPAAALAPPGSEAFDAAHDYGVDLFHHGYYWEAHEVWETLWHQVPRDTPLAWILQALIQGAARQIKCTQGFVAAAERLAASLGTLLERAAAAGGDPRLDWDLPTLSARLQRERHPLLTVD